MQSHLPDYGWRFQGKRVTVLRDHSNDAMMPMQVGALEVGVDKDRHRTCLQCGVCTASCGLAKDGDLFPRREMSLVQGGLFAKAAAMPTIWHCYQCDDCTEGCPSIAKPSEVMADLRKAAVEIFAVPRVLAKWVNRPLPFIGVAAASTLLIASLSLLFGEVLPDGEPIVFRRMFPHGALIGFFSAAALLSGIAAAASLRRIWQAWRVGSDDVFSIPTLTRAFGKALMDTLLHRRFSKCENHRFRGVPHAAVILGFVGLSVMAGVAAVLLWAYDTADFPMTSPFKIVANTFAVFLTAGLGILFYQRVKKHRSGVPARFFDWAFLSTLLLVAVTGLVSEILRVAPLEHAAYIVYFVHLIAVFLFLALLPFTKLMHAVYRFAAEVLREAQEINAENEKILRFAVGILRNAADKDASFEHNPAPPTIAKLDAAGSARDLPHNVVPIDASLLKLSPEELAELPDDALIEGYDRIRDRKIVDESGRPYFPGIQHLFNTPLEREKDRRETAQMAALFEKTDMQSWYEDAASKSCVWWLENHILMKHSLKSCMFCGMCTSVCPAAEYYAAYNPRGIVDIALSGDESAVETLLKSELIWYCGQCGSCKERCTRSNSVMGIISSMRQLAELKGYHLTTVRGRQQFAGRHLWASNFWNRGCSLYFRNVDPASHPDFGAAYEDFFNTQEEEFLRVGAHPDRDGVFGGRKIKPESLEELRRCAVAGGSIFLWQRIDEHGASDARSRRMDQETYLSTVRKEG